MGLAADSREGQPSRASRSPVRPRQPPASRGEHVDAGVFGNVISANMSPLRYTMLYLAVGFLAGFAHLAIDGEPAIGASGAINGMVGIAVAAYPRDRVSSFWWVLIGFGTTRMRLGVLVLIWLFFDLVGALGGAGGVAYWAHIGGLAAGIALGFLALTNNWIQMTTLDHATLLEVLGGPRSIRDGWDGSSE